jgi:type IV pilus assembly protein PilO
MELSLAKLPWYAQIGAFVLLGVVGMGLFYYYYELPARVDLDLRRNQLKTISGDITKGRTTATQLGKFRGEVDNLESRLTSLSAVLPEDTDAGDFLRQLQIVATQSNLTIKSFRPASTVTKQLHAEWPISLELDGTYHNLAVFFDRVGKFTRIVNISGLQIQGKDRPQPDSTITARCTATTFVLLERPQPAEGRGRGGRGRGAARGAARGARS